MKKLLCCICAAVLAIAAASPCLAADSPWNGTWKENLAKGKYTGTSVSITQNGSGYHFTNGPISYDFACDGKPYKNSGTSTISCKPTPDGGFNFTMTTNGQVTTTEHRSFSADGKLMTMKDTEKNGDGSTSTREVVRQRTSGTTGLVGDWVNAKVNRTEPDIVVISVNGDRIHTEYQHDKTSLDAKLDGSESTPSGPLVPHGFTISFKSAGPDELDIVRKIEGKVMTDATLTLSSDGKTLTEVMWRPGKENEKVTQVFEKQ